MPVISQFYGIIIRMFFQDNEKHHTPHIHAIYSEYEASFDLKGNIIRGEFPNKQKKIVEAWILIHEQELCLLWKTINEDNGFFTIEPLR